MGTAGSGYTWGRRSLILHSPGSAALTSTLQWSSAWPPFTSPQGAFHWSSITMPKVLVPGKVWQSEASASYTNGKVVSDHFFTGLPWNWHMTNRAGARKMITSTVFSASLFSCSCKLLTNRWKKKQESHPNAWQLTGPPPKQCRYCRRHSFHSVSRSKFPSAQQRHLKRVSLYDGIGICSDGFTGG